MPIAHARAYATAPYDIEDAAAQRRRRRKFFIKFYTLSCQRRRQGVYVKIYQYQFEAASAVFVDMSSVCSI